MPDLKFCSVIDLGVNLAKYWEGPSQSIQDWGRTPRTAKGRVGVGKEGDWNCVRSRTLSTVSRVDMMTAGYEKAEFSEICKWEKKLTDKWLDNVMDRAGESLPNSSVFRIL